MADTATEKPASRAKGKPSTARSIERWENEGGQTPKPAAGGTPTAKKAAKSTKPAPKTASFPPAVEPDRSRHRTAEARSKGKQIKQAGLESRLLGHVSSSVKRNQARRDSKNG